MKIDQKYYRTIQPSTEPIVGADQAKNETNFSVEIIDQTLLPHRFEMRKIQNLDEMIAAIKNMQVRGAPLIGLNCSSDLPTSKQLMPRMFRAITVNFTSVENSIHAK